MTMCHPRSSLFGAVLAIIAMLGLVALSGWHEAIVHDDDAIHAVSVAHLHQSAPSDPDAPIHVLAHATGQWVAPATSVDTPALVSLVDRIWSPVRHRLRGGLDPSGLLRPPRG